MLGYNVQFTSFANKSDIFSPVKNDIKSAATKPTPEAMATGEADLYKYWRKVLKLAGVNINAETPIRTTGRSIINMAQELFLGPESGRIVKDTAKKITGGSISDMSDSYY